MRFFPKSCESLEQKHDSNFYFECDGDMRSLCFGVLANMSNEYI